MTMMIMMIITTFCALDIFNIGIFTLQMATCLEYVNKDLLLLLLLLLKIRTAIEAGFVIGSGQQQVA